MAEILKRRFRNGITSSAYPQTLFHSTLSVKSTDSLEKVEDQKLLQICVGLKIERLKMISADFWGWFLPRPPPIILADFVPRRGAPEEPGPLWQERRARMSLRTRRRWIRGGAVGKREGGKVGRRGSCGNGGRWLQSQLRHLFHAVFCTGSGDVPW